MLLRLAAIGLAAGLLGAILGVGGGIVVVPLLAHFFGYDQRRAAATSMGAIAITATVGAISYAIQGHQHPWEAVLLGVPAAFGVVAGTAIQQRVPLRALQLSFAVLVALVGIRLLAPDALPFHEAHGRSWWTIPVGLAIGTLGGVLAGLFGVGGGLLFVPTFVLLLGLSRSTPARPRCSRCCPRPTSARSVSIATATSRCARRSRSGSRRSPASRAGSRSRRACPRRRCGRSSAPSCC